MQDSKDTRQRSEQIEEIFQTLKSRILLYSNLYIPDFVIYDLAKSLEEYYAEDNN